MCFSICIKSICFLYTAIYTCFTTFKVVGFLVFRNCLGKNIYVSFNSIISYGFIWYVLQIYQLKLSMGVLIRNLTEENNDGNKRGPSIYPQVKMWTLIRVTTKPATFKIILNIFLHKQIRLQQLLYLTHIKLNILFYVTLGCVSYYWVRSPGRLNDRGMETLHTEKDHFKGEYVFRRQWYCNASKHTILKKSLHG